MPHRMIRRSTFEQPPCLHHDIGYEQPFHGQYPRLSTAPTRSLSASEVEISPSAVQNLITPSYLTLNTQSPYSDPRSEVSTYPTLPIPPTSADNTDSPYFDSRLENTESPYFDPRPSIPTYTSAVNDISHLPPNWSSTSDEQYSLRPTSYHYNPHPLPLSPFDNSIPLPVWSSNIPRSDWPALPSSSDPAFDMSKSMISTQAKPPPTSTFGLHPSYSSHISIPPFGLDTAPRYPDLYHNRSESSSGSGSTSAGLMFSPLGEIQESSAAHSLAPMLDYVSPSTLSLRLETDDQSNTYRPPAPLPTYTSLPFPLPLTPTSTSLYPTSSTSTQSSPAHTTTPPHLTYSDRPQHFEFPNPKFEMHKEGPIKRGRKPKLASGVEPVPQEWDHVTDRVERRRIQNKLAQRIYRARHQNMGRKGEFDRYYDGI